MGSLTITKGKWGKRGGNEGKTGVETRGKLGWKRGENWGGNKGETGGKMELN